MTMRKLLIIDAILVALALIFAAVTPARAQMVDQSVRVLSAATTNSTLVGTGARMLDGLAVVNTTSAIYYLKFYDKATAPTCNTDTVKLTIPIPHATGAGYLVSPELPVGGIAFNAGIGLCLTGGLADNDNTNAATGVAINVFYR